MNTPPSTSDDEAITKISKNGDIILAVGPDEQKIQVASDFLEHVSPVFKAMFNAPMKEGEALRKRTLGSFVTISLPEDCPVAMENLLRILYGSDDLQTSHKEFYDIVTLADKYGMKERLGSYGASWLRMFLHGDQDPDYAECWGNLIIAHMLGDSFGFYESSVPLATLGEPVIDWGLQASDQELGIKLALAIEELRHIPREPFQPRSFRRGLCLDCFNNAKTSFCSRQEGCDHDDYHDD